MPREFDHRRLAVFDRAVDFYDGVLGIVAAARWPDRVLMDQLLRAGSSIVLNIAEGAGEFAAADKARFYRMAKRSAAECDAILVLLRRSRRIPPALLDPCETLLPEIAALLTTMILNREKAKHHPPTRTPIRSP